MRIYRLERQQWIEGPLGVVFDFFSRAENLGRITPSWMHFELRSEAPAEMHAGAQIDYRIRLAGLPLKWRTRIEAWEPGKHFIDVQERGPYLFWRHLHEFRAMDGGVLMTDKVDYALPLGWLGRAAHTLCIRTVLNAIFEHRYHRIRNLRG